MSNMARDPLTGDDGEGVSPPGTPPRVPRWVKVSAIVAGTLILLVVIVLVTGLGGDHGPGRHLGAGHTPSTGVLAVPLPSDDRR